MHTKAILLTASGVGIIGGGGIGTYYLINSSEAKNIKEKLIKEGTVLISTDDEYEISFKELKGKPEFITALQQKTRTIKESSALAEGRVALKLWCESNGKLNLSKTNTKDVLPKVKEYCKRLPLTIAEKLAIQRKTLVKDWKAKLKDLNSDTGGKKDPDIGTALGFTNLDSTNEDTFSKKLEDSCNDKIKTKINEDTTDAIWKEVEKRCID